MGLRDYQIKMIEDARRSLASDGVRSSLLVAPTGAGKGVMIAHITKEAFLKGKRTLIIAHRREILEQLSVNLTRNQVEHGFVMAGEPYDPSKLVQLGSVMTVIKRIPILQAPELVIVDEAHHAAKNNSWHKTLKSWPSSYGLGFSASPWRLSGEPLRDSFDDIVVGPSVAELIGKKHLANFKVYAPSQLDTSRLKISGGDFNLAASELAIDMSGIIGDCADHYKMYLKDKTAIAFCVTIKHAQQISSRFNAAAIPADFIHGQMNKKDRSSVIESLRAGKIKVLTNVGIATEGFDLPALDGVIMLRPTASLSLYLQMVGRALRPSPGKDHAIILDHVSNVFMHGFPDDDRQWSLEAREKRKTKDKQEASVKLCPKCFAACHNACVKCPECSHVFEVVHREDAEEKNGELEELKRENFKKRKKEQGSATTYSELVELGRKRGMKNPSGWAYHVLKARERKRAY